MKKASNKKVAHAFIFRRYITRNGVRIYPKNAKAFKIPITKY